MRKNIKILLTITIITIILLVGVIINLISNNKTQLLNKSQIIKEMSSSAQETELNNQINALNAEHTEYMNYVQTCKTQIATALTNEGVETSNEETLEKMSENISKVLQARTVDATATADNITEGKTAYVNGELITGNGANCNTYYETGYNDGYNKGFSTGKTSITGSFTNKQVEDYYTYTDFIINTSGYATLNVSSNANYWYVYNNSTGSQIGSRCQTVFDISNISSIKIRVQCSVNNNNGYAVTTYTIS